MVYASTDPNAETGRKLLVAPHFKSDTSWEKIPGADESEANFADFGLTERSIVQD